jgi:hypothetical protein
MVGCPLDMHIGFARDKKRKPVAAQSVGQKKPGQTQ